MPYLLLALALLLPTNVWAADIPKPLSKEAQSVLDTVTTAGDKGLAIIKEADRRDLGFGDFTVSVKMALTNTNGGTSSKEMRNKTFEMENPDVGDKTLIVFDRPRDVKGTAFLTYSKILEADDQWLYLPALKRVKRISSKNKSGPFVGSEFAYEDISSQEVGKYSYKYIGMEACPTDKALTCFMVEFYPLYEHSGYTKQIMWMDADEFRPQKTDFYDRKDDLLKTLTYEGYQQYLGQYWRADKFSMQNHQNGKATVLEWNDYKFRTGIKESDLVKAKLKNAK